MGYDKLYDVGPNGFSIHCPLPICSLSALSEEQARTVCNVLCRLASFPQLGSVKGLGSQHACENRHLWISLAFYNYSGCPMHLIGNTESCPNIAPVGRDIACPLAWWTSCKEVLLFSPPRRKSLCCLRKAAVAVASKPDR